MNKLRSENRPRPVPLWSVVALTASFVGAYFVLRALPDAECGFLHYEEVVNADGEIEFCATNHAGFLDLTRLVYPVKMDLVTTDVDEAASNLAERNYRLRLIADGGRTIAPYEMAITHTKKMHVMLIDPSLEDYHHVHPIAEGIDGTFHFSFQPRRAGNYSVFTEIVPIKTRRQIIATGSIAIPGAVSEARFERNEVSVVDGVKFTLTGLPKVLRKGVDYALDLEVSASDGGDILLEDIMGAKGHMVAFDAKRKGFAHMHPADSIYEARAGLSALSRIPEEQMTFFFNVPEPGWYRLFAQVQVAGREVFGRFDIEVKD